MILKKILLCILSSIIIFSLIGCGQNSNLSKNNNKSDSTKVEKVPKKEEVQLTLGVSKSLKQEEKVLDTIIDKFQEKYPNIKVNKQIITKNYDSVIEKKVSNGKELDVFLVDVSKFPLYVSKDYIEPIDKYIDKDVLNDFYPNVVKSFQKDGKTFGLPEYYNLMVLFYNKRIFKNRGIEDTPTDWRELEIVCDKITKNKISALVFDNNFKYFGTFMLQAGGKIIEDSNIVFDSSGGIKGLAYYFTLIKKGYADTPKDLKESSSINAFLKDKSGMYIGKSNLINNVENGDISDKYGIAMLPKGIKNGNFIFTHSYVISKNSEHKNEAAELIKFIISEDAQKIISNSGVGVPSRISMEHKYLQKYPKRQILIDMLYNSRLYQFGIKHDDIVNALIRAANKVQSGNTIPKDALDIAKREIENK